MITADLTGLKNWLNITDSARDGQLTLLLNAARDEILAYTNRDEARWLPCFDAIALQLAVMYYNRLGAEGMDRFSQGRVSARFSQIPSAITARLDRYRLGNAVAV